MNLLELKDKIKSHLVAGYPGLFIQSGEEARVDAMLQDVAAQLRLNPKEWNLGYGWVDFFNKQPRSSQGGETDLAGSLPALLDDDLDHKLFIIKDARNALENQPLAVARLKQLLNRIQRHHSGKAAVVLVSETLHIPPSIEAQITLLPLPLPRGEEISEQLDDLCQRFELTVPENLRQRLHAACSGLSQEEIRSALAMVRLQHEQINDAALALIQHEKEQIIAKSGVLEMLRVNENATDIGGLENLKQWLGRRAQIFRRLGEARAARVQAPKGVLIAGMPGCGKSLTAKAAAGLFQLPLLRLDIGALLGKYVGESEHNMRRALTMAESVSPCILWIDELEKAFVGMSSGSGSEVSSRLFGYFLTWMQEKTGAVFVIATANNITALPPELLRKGRFDEVFYVGFPNAIERGAILDIHLKGEGLELGSHDRSKLVTQCRDYAGADIQNAINEARETAFIKGRALVFDDLETAIEATVPLRETLRDQVAKYEELFEKLKLKPASRSDGLGVAQMIQMADSLNALRREEVARHEDCPDDLLEKLAGDAMDDIRRAVYRNPNCPERVLTQRINIGKDQDDFDLDLLHLACIHPHAPQDLLAAQFERLQLNVEHRRLLAGRTGHESLHAKLLLDQDLEVRRALAKSRHVNDETQRLLAKDADVDVRLALIQNGNLLEELQAVLARDPDAEVRGALARLDELVESVQLLLSNDADVDVRLALASREGRASLPDSVQLELLASGLEVRLKLAKNDNLGAPAQLLLAQDHHADVRKTLARHSALTTAATQCLVKDEEGVKTVLAGNASLNSALLQRELAQSGVVEIRQALAGNSGLGIEVIALLARDPAAPVRATLARNRNLDADAVETLLLDQDEDVRKAVVTTHSTHCEAHLQRLLEDPSIEVRKCLASEVSLSEDMQKHLLNQTAEIHKALASNASLDEKIQQQLVANGGVAVRRALASNRCVTGTTQAMLADDSALDVRERLAQNPSLADPVFSKLLKDEESVRVALVNRPELSDTQQSQLAATGCLKTREELAGKHDLCEALMRELGEPVRPPRQSDYWTEIPEHTAVHIALAANGALPEALQLSWLESWKDVVPVLEALAGNSSLSAAAQHQLAKRKEASIRESLAANWALIPQLLDTLLDDPVSSVRTTLISKQRLSAEQERTLAEHHSSETRMALAANQNLRKRTQLTLATDWDSDVRMQLVKEAPRYWRSALSTAVQATLAKDDEEGVRKALTEYPKLSPDVQVQLASDDATEIRKNLAAQGQGWFGFTLCDEAQLCLAKDYSSEVRVALASNPKLLERIEVQLAGDPAREVRMAVLERGGPGGFFGLFRGSLSVGAQKVLATDQDVGVRLALVDKLFAYSPPPTSEEVLLILASDRDPRVKDKLISSIRVGETRFNDMAKVRLFDGLDGDACEALRDILEGDAPD